MYFSHFDSPVGPLLLAADESGLRQLAFPCEKTKQTPPSDWQENGAFFGATTRQLTAYFAGQLRTFDLPLAPQGTPFQLQVWQTLPEIPYGQTRTYTQIAEMIGRPRAVRAVGAANGANPLPILVPCHRVIGANGSLTGFGGGLAAKSYLLGLESAKWQTDAKTSK